VLPVPSDAPPVEAAYQLIVAVDVDAVAPNVKVPGPQRAAGVVPVMVGISLTVAEIAVLEPVVQPIAVAST